MYNLTHNHPLFDECKKLYNSLDPEANNVELIINFEEEFINFPFKFSNETFNVIKRTIENSGLYDRESNNRSYTYFKIFDSNRALVDGKRMISFDSVKIDNNKVRFENSPLFCRVSIEKEVELNDLMVTDEDTWTIKKYKDTISFSRKLFDGSFIYLNFNTYTVKENLKYVENSSLIDDVKSSNYNTIEIRLKSDFKIDSNHIREYVNEIKYLVDLLNRIKNDPFIDVTMKECHSNELVQEYMNIMTSCVNANYKRTDFFGSMPVNLLRKDLETISKNEYYISDKTDGIRYLLFIYKSELYLINRSCKFYRVSGYNFLADWISSSRYSTLIDGEMVRNLKTYEPNFLIFDCIIYNGHHVGKLNLDERLSKVGEIISNYRRSMASSSFRKFPFLLIGKVMLPKRQIKQVLNNIKDRHNEKVFEDEKRCHRVDGLIFTSKNTPYKLKTDQLLFKWKYVELLSVDFKIEFKDNNTANLYLTGDYNKPVRCFTANLLEEDIINIKNDIAKESHLEEYIVELVYDKNNSVWRYRNLRPDKNTPNHITTGFGTLISVIENIDIKEIESIVLK